VAAQLLKRVMLLKTLQHSRKYLDRAGQHVYLRELGEFLRKLDSRCNVLIDHVVIDHRKDNKRFCVVAVRSPPKIEPKSNAKQVQLR
jgi:hypothetical protein